MKLKLLLSLFAQLLPLVAWAYGSYYQDSVTQVNYVFYTETGTAYVAPGTYNAGRAYSGSPSATGCIDILSSFTVDGIEYTVTGIPSYAFYGCNLTSVTIPNSVTSIGYGAFKYCHDLTSVTIPSSMTSIGGNAFYECSGLTSVYITAVEAWCNIYFEDNYANPFYYAHHLFLNNEEVKELVIPNSVTYIVNGAFRNCSGLTSVTIGNSVESIGYSVFSGCTNIENVEITSRKLTSIGSGLFEKPVMVTLAPLVPPTLASSNTFGQFAMVRVPDQAVEVYREADVWSDIKKRIIGYSTKTDYDVSVKAYSSASGLLVAIGEDNMNNVVSLKVSGNINSYDIMMMRNKMDNLHYLDLTDANIVANPQEYYQGYHTEDDVLGGYSFYNLTKLIRVKQPKSIKSIGRNAFQGCTNLKEVFFQEGLQTIGSYAFQKCSNLEIVDLPKGVETINDYAFTDCENLKTLNLRVGLKRIGSFAFGTGTSSYAKYQPKIDQLILPEGLESIGYDAFGYNKSLKRVAFPAQLKTIGEGAFYGCSQLDDISLPASLERIGGSTFYGCSSLKEVHIPSSVRSIGGYAFGECNNLEKVHTYIVEPPNIDQNTFSTYTTTTLMVPKTSYYNYYFNTQWSQFRNLDEFDAEYAYFYLTGDFEIGDEKGFLLGDDIDADLYPGSGLIVTLSDEQGNQNKQQLATVHVRADNSKGSSIISDDNLTIGKLYFDIEVQQGRWYFMSFPFRVKRENIEAPGLYVFRYYDGATRANGKTGWTDWTADELTAGQGYIFQTNQSGTLSLGVEHDDMNWQGDDRTEQLTAHAAQQPADASWNFVGNPHTSYFDIDDTGYEQPITVWNGSSYEAVRPGDDSYQLRPFEAFFVQKPEGASEIGFPADSRATYTQTMANAEAKQARHRAAGVSTERQIVNLTISDGQATDKTRVVFNAKKSTDYEMDCDAAKFLSSEPVPQLYTMDGRQTRYAINERPLGEVPVGYVATAEGDLTISATRMDQPMLLVDRETGITHDLAMGDYTFTTAAGTYERRFMLVIDNSVTAIGKVKEQTGVSLMSEQGGIAIAGSEGHDVSIFSIDGIGLARQAGDGVMRLPRGTYVVKVDRLTTKIVVR